MIALYKGKSFRSRLIRWFTWSDYSHVAWIHDPTGRVYQAWARGVTETATLSVDHTPGTHVDLFRVAGETIHQRESVRCFMDDRLGLPYDFLGILGFVTRSGVSQSHQDRWFCSELVAAAYADAALPLLKRRPAYKISPGQLATSPLLVHVRMVMTDNGGTASVPSVPHGGTRSVASAQTTPRGATCLAP